MGIEEVSGMGWFGFIVAADANLDGVSLRSSEMVYGVLKVPGRSVYWSSVGKVHTFQVFFFFHFPFYFL